MQLNPGHRLGLYEILGPAGSGGMGEVYRGRDTRLHRNAAIKILPAGAAGDEMNRSRFAREAKAISALAHPNICTLYDVGSDDDVDYPVEDAWRLIEEHAPRFGATSGAWTLTAVDEGSSTLTYEVVWRGGGEEKTVVVDLGYGDGLLWLREAVARARTTADCGAAAW